MKRIDDLDIIDSPESNHRDLPDLNLFVTEILHLNSVLIKVHRKHHAC